MTERYGLDVPPHERRPVPWYALVGLRSIAQQQLWSMNLLRNLDRRETFTGRLEWVDLRQPPTRPDTDAGDFWFDFLADTGDGGSASYAVARGVLAASLAAEGAAQPLPEGQLLILGGDLAYPGSSPELYQSRLVEMFELARDQRSTFSNVPRQLAHDAPWQADHKLVAAIPQNHDWFDSASTFCRYFVNDEKAGLVGARSPQRQTYFAFALPHHWFVLGFDWALTGDLDRHQFEAFSALIESGDIPSGAHLLLIYPEPYWTRPLDDQVRSAYPLRFQRLEALMLQHGLNIRLRLAGDLHHYARERLDSAPPARHSSDLVTCGSGGAFGHATHTREVLEPKVMQWASEPEAAQAELQGRVVVGRQDTVAAAEAEGLCFRPTQGEREGRGDAICYPPLATSRAQAWGNVMALLRLRGEPWWRSNLSFSLLIGLLLLIGGLTAAQHGPGPAAIGRNGLWAWVSAILGSPWSIVAHVGLGVNALFLATDNDPAHSRWGDRLWALSLWALLCVLTWFGTTALLLPGLGPWWPLTGVKDPLSVLAALVDGGVGMALRTGGLALAALLGATVLGGLTVGTWLTALSRLGGRAVTNVSSALSLQGHKGFLRFRLGPDGLEAFMLGCDEVPQRWAPVPGATPSTRPYWNPAPSEPALRWRVVDRFTMGS